ncbi:MAG: SPOR domain-containing protein [Nitrospinae bacterium]|nr:SPOR domain-containing protein [Nitrospinota bacterium]
MNKNTILLLIWCLFFFFISVDKVSSFSIGQIKVNSSFGDRFDAEVLVDTDGMEGVEVFVGDEEDYTMLGLERPDIVDNIYISLPLGPIKNGKQAVRLISDKPIFYPSFDLVIKAKLKGGAIIEKFFLAADFQKNLMLGIPPELEKVEVEKRLSEPYLKEEIEKIRDKEREVEEQGTEDEEIQEGEKEEVIQKEEEGEAKRELIVEKEAVVEGEGTESGESESKGTYNVIRGDTLYKIVSKIDVSAENADQVVAALWYLNKDRFTLSNMNCIDVDVHLDYSGVKEVSATIPYAEARRIIKSQWSEWKKIRGEVRSIGTKAWLGAFSNEVPLPEEEDSDDEGIIKGIVLEWKDAWEKGYIDIYMSYYSKRFGSEEGLDWEGWKIYKRDFNERHKNIDISIEGMRLRREKGMIIASFIQYFSSNIMSSIGMKLLYFVKEGDDWKIIRERWDKRLPTQRERYPYVVHVSSNIKPDNIVYEINRWRNEGYSAYAGLFILPEKGNWYRVFVERFPTEHEADDFAIMIKAKRLTEYAKTMKMPYAIEVGLYGSKSQIGDAIERLRGKGYSPYILTVDIDGKFVYRVLICAYATLEQAQEIAKKIEQDGIKHEIVQP